MDKKTICFISVFHAAEPTSTLMRRCPDGAQVDISCPPPPPPLLADRQQCLRVVDVGAQLIFYRKEACELVEVVFAYIVEACILNSHVPYSQYTDQNILPEDIGVEFPGILLTVSLGFDWVFLLTSALRPSYQLIMCVYRPAEH